MTKRYNVLDLFCGCGGLSLGFEMAGFDVKLAIDNWEDALVTYRKNHKGTKTLNADLLNLNPQDVEQEYNIHDIDVIIGGPPCQGFSVAGKRIIDDDKALPPKGICDGECSQHIVNRWWSRKRCCTK